MAVPESQQYASTFYTLWQGHALWVPKPNSNLGPEYGQIGVWIGDVSILNTNGT
ncbi:hypothetical protein L218DRAFT_880075 [Marasmius fiardii PR-910]|nr:hypothetical protein L218DRAFT_880075 [Marasmius fiardii PR-910]